MWVKKSESAAGGVHRKGYLAGSGWEDYKRTGRVSGIPLASGLIEAQKLEEPLLPLDQSATRRA